MTMSLQTDTILRMLANSNTIGSQCSVFSTFSGLLIHSQL